MASLEKRAKDSRQQVGGNFLPSLVPSLWISSEKIICLSCVTERWWIFTWPFQGSANYTVYTLVNIFVSNNNDIIIGLPVAPNYKMGFLCRKRPEKPEKSVIIIYTSQNITLYIKTTALHNRQPNELRLWGSCSNIKNKHNLHCNFNYWPVFFLCWTRPYSCIWWGNLKRLCLKSPLP